MIKTLAAALSATTLTALFVAAPLAAQAQPVPSYARQPAYANPEEQIRGRIASFDGRFNLTVRDERGFLDNVQLRPGTIINPTGITLAGGMIVSIFGYNAGPYFSANEIDTPYTFYEGMPYYYGHPWRYYGPTVSLDFFFGNPGWWHGNYYHGGYYYHDGARVYRDVAPRHAYYAAPQHGYDHGGQGHGYERGDGHDRR